MLQPKRFLFSAALLALALSLTMYAGNAEAVYLGDGAVQNGTTGGWDIVEYGACVTGIDAAGNMIIDSSITSRPDCIARTFPAYTTQAACGNAANADGAHFWASTCVDASNNGISLSGLDRTASMCAKKGGSMKTVCTSAWQHLGPSGAATEGFCYAAADVTSLYGTQAACPTTAGYSWSGTLNKCFYGYGITGYNGTTDRNVTALQAIKNLAGTTMVAVGAGFDASAYTTMGQCISNGFQWNNYAIKTGTATLATTPDPSIIGTDVSGTMEGCLRCHNSTTQYNGYAERWKETYLKTGHKNMLRKVTAGENWAGPEGIYSVDDSGNSIDFANGEITVSGIARKLFYLFGDWMAPNPRAVYNTNGDGTTANSYSCAACHTSGWSNAAAGVCYPDSTKTTAAACASPNTWVPSTGVQGTVGAEPQASFPGITGITGKWDLDGIQCSRCHNSTNPAVTGTGTHHGTQSSETSNNLCFGCHQSPATTYVAQNIGGIDYPANAKILDPAMIPTGVHHGADSGREFNGHVLGNSFLNSSHARFTGTLVPNSVGKYDIAGGTYDSAFSGKICRTSTTLGSGSILKTNADGSIIKTLADCNSANSKTDPAANYGYWQSEGQGKCTTCHDVHQSVVPAVGAHEPFVRECDSCHNDVNNAAGYQAAGVKQITHAKTNHPIGAGTPLDSTLYKNACEKCHMPKSTDEGMPMHLWRINTDADYSTFPSMAAFYGGSCSVNTTTITTAAACTTAGGVWTTETKDRRAMTAPDGSYANAVWVDLDAACGQCHGGGSNSTDNPPAAGMPYFSKKVLAQAAYNMHNTKAQFTWSVDRNVSYQVNFTAANSPVGSYDWDFGDGTTGSGQMVSHVYADGTPVTATLTVGSLSGSRTVTPAAVNAAPVASKSAPVVSGMSVSFSDTSTDDQDPAALVVTVNWGDGTSSTGNGGDLFSKTYASAGSYVIRHGVIDAGGLTSSSANKTVTIAEKFTIGGAVVDGAGAPVAGAKLSLKMGYTVKSTTLSAADGAYSFNNLLKGCYTVVPSMTGKTFTPASKYLCVGPSNTSINFTAN